MTFREIVSGHRRGVGAALARAALSAAEHPYRLAVAWRNRRFDRGHTTTYVVDVPVISVGNITVGGTGKTPMVAWLAKWFRARGIRPALISRGYGAQRGKQNDEALELAQALPGVPHVQGADRVAAARAAIDEFAAELILLDDAFQHRRLARDLDLVLIDALQPFGFEHLLPRGLLREPLAGLGRAQVIAISRCDLATTAVRKAITTQLHQHAPEAALVQVAHRPQGLIAASGRRETITGLVEAPVAAFCGIGNPTGFRRTLEACGWRPAGFLEFADHHAYSADDLRQLGQWAASLQAGALLCTCKDLVKIQRDQLGQTPLWALEIGIEIVSGSEDLEQRLQSILTRVDRREQGSQA